jgi:hypothetical protein
MCKDLAILRTAGRAGRIRLILTARAAASTTPPGNVIGIISRAALVRWIPLARLRHFSMPGPLSGVIVGLRLTNQPGPLRVPGSRSCSVTRDVWTGSRLAPAGVRLVGLPSHQSIRLPGGRGPRHVFPSARAAQPLPPPPPAALPAHAGADTPIRAGRSSALEAHRSSPSVITSTGRLPPRRRSSQRVTGAHPCRARARSKMRPAGRAGGGTLAG